MLFSVSPIIAERARLRIFQVLAVLNQLALSRGKRLVEVPCWTVQIYVTQRSRLKSRADLISLGVRANCNVMKKTGFARLEERVCHDWQGNY